MMKTLKILFLLIVINFTINICIGQQPYKLVDSSNKWFEYGQYGGWGYYDLQLVRLTYFFNGDTIINSQSYKKLFHDRRDTIYSTPNYIQNSYGYTAAFRQDSMKVYFIMKNSTVENLYCDFNLSVGDTLKYYYNQITTTVNSITTIPFGNSTRKKYALSNGSYFYDGIGNWYGLFHDFSVGIEGGVYLACFEQNNIIQNVYAWGTSPECGLSVTEIKELISMNNLIVYPNPFSKETTLYLSDNLHNSILIIYNLFGQEVKKMANLSGRTVNINRDNLSNGIYNMKIIQDGKIKITKKLIIQD